MKRLTLFILLLMLGSFSSQAASRNYKTLTHIVNPSEDAGSIAVRYGVDIEALVEDNPGVDLLEISTGQRLAVRRLKRKEKSSSSQIMRQWRLFQQNALIEQEAPMPGEDSAPSRDIKTAVVSDVSGSGFKNITPGGTLEVVMLLPLKGERGAESQFVDFYRGALVALDELKKENRKVNISVYNTARSAQVVSDLIASEALKDADLIIGPVFEEPFKVAAEYAAQIKVPIVSPLAVIADVENSFVFQAPVSQGDRYDDIKHLISPDNNVVVFSGQSDDASLYEGLQPYFSDSTRLVKYEKELEVEQMEEFMTDQQDNVFIVLPGAELEVDEILARLSSVQNNLIATSRMRPKISIIGGSRWLRFANIDRTMFFKLNMHCVTSYHADRGNNAVRVFDDKYLKSYGSLPSLYAYRGYDVAKMFVYGVGYYGGDFVDNINNVDVDLLQTPYNFERATNGNVINTEWVTVRYGSDFNIRVLNAKGAQQETYDFQRIELPKGDFRGYNLDDQSAETEVE